MEIWPAAGRLEGNMGSPTAIIESSGAATKLIVGRWLLSVGNGSFSTWAGCLNNELGSLNGERPLAVDCYPLTVDY